MFLVKFSFILVFHILLMLSRCVAFCCCISWLTESLSNSCRNRFSFLFFSTFGFFFFVFLFEKLKNEIFTTAGHQSVFYVKISVFCSAHLPILSPVMMRCWRKITWFCKIPYGCLKLKLKTKTIKEKKFTEKKKYNINNNNMNSTWKPFVFEFNKSKKRKKERTQMHIAKNVNQN